MRKKKFILNIQVVRFVSVLPFYELVTLGDIRCTRRGSTKQKTVKLDFSLSRDVTVGSLSTRTTYLVHGNQVTQEAYQFGCVVKKTYRAPSICKTH